MCLLSDIWELEPPEFGHGIPLFLRYLLVCMCMPVCVYISTRLYAQGGLKRM